ncbi:uncharacterized protein M8220_015951 [Acridotheres tristis]
MVDTILQLMSSHLQCDCKEIRRLVLRGLLVLCKSPWKASLKTLLQATEFLKKRKFKRLLKREQPWRCSECLLAKDRNTTDKYWHQSLAYLQSSQESMREVAIEFIGLIGQHMRGRWQEEFQIICDALLGMASDISPSVSSLAVQTQHSMSCTKKSIAWPSAAATRPALQGV